MTPIFIPSYHRADNIKTAKYLHRMGYDMRDVYVFIDDEGGDETEYREACERFGCNLIVFSLREARKNYDFVHRPSKAQRAAGQARNMFADWAKAHNIDFYCVQDDDTTGFEMKSGEHNSMLSADELPVLTTTFMYIERMMRKRSIGCFAIGQSGDLIGGESSFAIYKRKVMNCTFYLPEFIQAGERGVQDNDTSQFCSIWNEGLFTGTTLKGLILHQMQSAKQKGGLTDLYNECKLLNKALVCVIQYPSAVIAERQKKNGNRIHHRINYRYLAPCILKGGERDNIAWDTYPEDVPFTSKPTRVRSDEERGYLTVI